MRLLSVVRHAKSDWNDPTLSDAERPLNARGQRDAPAMGQRLAAEECRPDLMVSSPATRAMQTATLLATELGYPPEAIVQVDVIYEASLGTLQSVVESLPDNATHVMLIGHNPGFESLCNYIDPDQPVSFVQALSFYGRAPHEGDGDQLIWCSGNPWESNY